MLDSAYRILEHFEISHYGFLPVEEPLSSLLDPYYQPWELLIKQLPDSISKARIYDEFDLLPMLETDRLSSLPELRRAYVILTFFTHAYIWSDEVPHETLPPNITVPLLKVSQQLDLPPTATYPALNLWNCGLIRDGADITNPENVVMRHTFTGTEDEAWFYAVSVSVEAKGVRAIQLMLKCNEAIERNEHEDVLECLHLFRVVIVELSAILHRMHERCAPSVFYHRIRPFLAGSRNMAKAGLPRGIFYDEGDGKGSWRQYSGGSNAQSTLIQFLDISLGVAHEATGSTRSAQGASRQMYLDEMRKYMPQAHRLFLKHWTSTARLQEYVHRADVPPAISAVFNQTVDAMTAFRDEHTRIVARYIVLPSRESSSGTVVANKNIASVSSEEDAQSRLKGTGGTELMSFLKQTRDETYAARTFVEAV